MEYFTASCLCKGKVSVDGVYQGESKEGNALHVFQCGPGLHDVTLEFQTKESCHRKTMRVMIAGTTRIAPLAIPFICEL